MPTSLWCEKRSAERSGEEEFEVTLTFTGVTAVWFSCFIATLNNIVLETTAGLETLQDHLHFNVLVLLLHDLQVNWDTAAITEVRKLNN